MTVVDLPVAKRLCSGCENGYLGQGGVFCRFFREDIFDETVAAECEEFDPIPPGPVRVRISGPSLVPETIVLNDRGKHTSLDETGLEDACERLLARSRSTLWGQYFEIKSEAGRREAAVWLAGQFREVAAVYSEEGSDAGDADQHAHEAGALPAAERDGQADRPPGKADPPQGEQGGGAAAAHGPEEV